MSKSKEQLQQAVLDVGEQFAASMDTLLDTELRYLKYLRDRKRFHIGVRNIISNRLGSGQLPPDDPKSTRRRRNPRRPNPGGIGVPIPIPLFVPERQYEQEEPEQEPIDVFVPEKQPQNQDEGANDIKDFEREPVKEPVFPEIEVFVPENENQGEDIIEPNGGLVTVPSGDTGQVFDGPLDEIYAYEGLGNFFSAENLNNIGENIWSTATSFAEFVNKVQALPWVIGGAIWQMFWRGDPVFGAEENEDYTGIFSQPTETIIGEDGAEVVLPVDELGDLISLVYKDGAQVFIGTSQDFLSGLPSSPGKTSVLGDANRLASIFGISDKGDGSSALSFGMEEPLTFDSTSTIEEENIEEVIDTPVDSSGTFKEDGTYVPPGFEKATTIDQILDEEPKVEIDTKELVTNQNKANIVSDGSEQVKIPSDGNGEDRFGNDIILNNSTELAWQKAIRAAALDGVDLTSGVNSSFRTPDQQQQLLDLQAAGDPLVTQVAEIGTSPHQQGWGLDIAIGSPAHQWMLQNGKKYGFEWSGTEDAVHFNFVNNESNTKYLNDLQPRRSRNNMERDLAPVSRDKADLLSKKAKAKIGATAGALAGLGMMSNDIVAPDLQTDKAIVSNEQVNQIDKNQAMISTQPNMIPIPIQTTVQVPVPIAKNETKEIRRTLIIDTFDKGSRVEVAYV